MDPSRHIVCPCRDGAVTGLSLTDAAAEPRPTVDAHNLKPAILLAKQRSSGVTSAYRVGGGHTCDFEDSVGSSDNPKGTTVEFAGDPFTLGAAVARGHQRIASHRGSRRQGHRCDGRSWSGQSGHDQIAPCTWYKVDDLCNVSTSYSQVSAAYGGDSLLGGWAGSEFSEPAGEARGSCQYPLGVDQNARASPLRILPTTDLEPRGEGVSGIGGASDGVDGSSKRAADHSNDYEVGCQGCARTHLRHFRSFTGLVRWTGLRARSPLWLHSRKGAKSHPMTRSSTARSTGLRCWSPHGYELVNGSLDHDSCLGRSMARTG
jgi:hypothetical protein